MASKSPEFGSQEQVSVYYLVIYSTDMDMHESRDSGAVSCLEPH